MTPENLIGELAALVVAHRDQDALDLASRCMPEVGPTMTTEQVVRVADLMHIAQMTVDLEEWASTKDAPHSMAGARSS